VAQSRLTQFLILKVLSINDGVLIQVDTVTENKIHVKQETTA